MQDDHRLTPSTLQLLGSSKSRREDVVHSYISSLARFSRAHADEGRAVLDSWSAGACEQDRRPDPLIRESGFATPILKPRTAAVDNINDDSRGQCVSDTFTTRKHAHGIKSSQEMEKSAFKLPLKSPLSNATHLDVALRTKNSLKLGKTTARGISGPKSSSLNRSSKKRLANDESDEERAMRLAQRRKRKRSKRIIIASPASHSSSISDEEGIQSKEGAHERKGVRKKNNLAKIPAGLALMHGFSATNVGKNRLTMVPGAGPGVFNKGKASLRTDIVIRKSPKPKELKNTFSETRFLNHTGATKPVVQKCKHPSRLPSSCGSRSIRSSEAGCLPSTPAPKGRAKLRRDRGKIKPVHRQASLDRLGSEDNATSDDRPMNSKAKAVMHRTSCSEVWDIEIEGRDLPSESGGSISCRSSNNGARVMDIPRRRRTTQGLADNLAMVKSNQNSRNSSRALSCRSHSTGAMGSITRPRSRTGSVREGDRQLDSSLGPSESASQIALRHSLSKYFTTTAPDPPLPTLQMDSIPECSPIPGDDNDNNSSKDVHSFHEARSATPVTSLDMTVTKIQPHSCSSTSLRVCQSKTCSSPNSLERALQELEADDLHPDVIRSTSSLYSPWNRDGFYKEAIPRDDHQLSLETDIHSEAQGDFRQRPQENLLHLPLMHHLGDVEEPDALGNFHLNFGGSDDYRRYKEGSYWANALFGFDEMESHQDYMHDQAVLDSGFDTSENPKILDHSRDYSMYSDHGDIAQPFPDQTLPALEFLTGETRDETQSLLEGVDYVSDADEVEALTQPWLSQGRALLLGLSGESGGPSTQRPGLKHQSIHFAEEDVARNLKDHWLPQRL